MSAKYSVPIRSQGPAMHALTALLGISLVQASAAEPGTPTAATAWREYNAAIEAYRAGDYAKADEAWQTLSIIELPDALRSKVWFQSGNAAFRIGERSVKGEPENALRDWMRAREAFRVATANGPVRTEAKLNLDLVEKNIVRLNLDLAAKLEASVKNQDLDKTVELLQAATVYAHQATDVAPEHTEAKQAVARTETALQKTLQKRGREHEKKADEPLKNGTKWDLERAKAPLNAALADFEAGLSLSPKDGTLNLDRQRVVEKLAKLHNDSGAAEKKTGDQSAQWSADQAEKDYQKALAEFDQSLGVKPENNPEAERGREETLAALEKLQLRQADHLAQQGRQDAARNPERAAEELGEAADRYQEAMNLNPQNDATPPKLEAVRKDLAPLLEKLGRQAQARAKQAEPRSTEQAVQELEKAETAFDRAQQADEKSETAKQGSEEVQKDLERLRQKMAKQDQGKDGKGKGKGEGKDGKDGKQAKEAKAAQELAEMMEELNREQMPPQDRRRLRQDRFTPPPVRTTRNW